MSHDDQSEIDQYDQFRIKSVSKKAWFAFLTLLLVGCYGFTTYCFFLFFFAGKNDITGTMFLSFLVGLPFTIGFISAHIIRRHLNIKFFLGFLLCLLPLMGVIFASYIFMGEGVICVIMALPFFISILFMGCCLGWSLAAHQKNSKKLVSLIALAPLAFGSVEQHFQPQDTYHRLEKEILINAPAEEIWPLLLNPQDIKPSELSDGLAYKIGAPYPVGASTPTPEVGAMRHSVWQMGITFDEEITAIRENEYIEWKYHFYDHSFPAGSLDDHIVIGGTYFDLNKTSYSLKPTENGTVLAMSVTYRISTNFNWYAGLWGDLLIQDTAQTLLEFYKKRSEAL